MDGKGWEENYNYGTKKDTKEEKTDAAWLESSCWYLESSFSIYFTIDEILLQSDAIQKSRFYIERKKNSGHIVPWNCCETGNTLVGAMLKSVTNMLIGIAITFC